MEPTKDLTIEQKIEDLKQTLEARLADGIGEEPSELSDLDLEGVVGGGTEDCSGGGG